jgi:Glycosyl hydrolase family 99
MIKRPLSLRSSFNLVLALVLSALAACTASTPNAAPNATKTKSEPTTQPTSAPATARAPTLTPAPTAEPKKPLPPVFAYYYIWFDPSSWDRAKIDFPLLGHYASDDETVMRQHIQWAKEAGINGFIVGWKQTEKLNSRLAMLVRLSHEEQFKLILIYQALDFERDPLVVDRIEKDLDYFIQEYDADPAFNVFGSAFGEAFNKPVVIWSGTWKFSLQDIERVGKSRRSKIQLLASEKSVQDYERVASLVDGNAYYWSSINAETNNSFGAKLNDMAAAVHAHGGLWLAPAAPGFDARLVGGTKEVPRKDGEQLRAQVTSALASSPDALGIISWNEFSENSYIEPSEKYGHRYLEVLSELLGVIPTPSATSQESP